MFTFGTPLCTKFSSSLWGHPPHLFRNERSPVTLACRSPALHRPELRGQAAGHRDVGGHKRGLNHPMPTFPPLPMHRGDAPMDETRWAAEFLFRYMMARYLCKEGTLSPGAPDYLARQISHGRRVFDDILIFTDPGPRIINDAKAADFFVAIINGYDGAMPEMDPAELAEW